MSIIINAKGTSVPFFKIGKTGVTLYQGPIDPSLIYTMVNGDYWFDTTTNSSNMWNSSGSAWAAPKAGDIGFTGSTIAAGAATDLTLKTDAGKHIVLDTASGSVTLSTTGSKDLYINPSATSGGNLYLNGDKWPVIDGTANQVLATNGSGALQWASIPSSFVTSFNTRSGSITLDSTDVTTALTFTPYNATNPAGYTTNTGTITSVAGTGTVSGLTLTGTVTTTGSLTLGGTLSLTSGDVTTALGFTPYNATNPSGYITSAGTAANISGIYAGTLTSTQVTSALTFTPYNATNPAGYISGITSGNVTTALGFTPYNATNPAGYTTNTGTVTSVAVSGGTTGLTTSGGPVTTSGTITLAGTLIPANGGTGLTTVGTANQVMSTNAAGTAIEYKTLTAGDGIDIVQSAGVVTFSSVTALSTKTANYALVSTDAIILVNGTCTITLPSAVVSPVGKQFTIKNIGTGTVTIASTAGTIDGSVSMQLINQYAGNEFVSDGANWWII